MKVKELIEELKNLDPELRIIKSADPEGNQYFNIYGIGIGYTFNDIETRDRTEDYFDEDDEESLQEYQDDPLVEVVCIW